MFLETLKERMAGVYGEGWRLAFHNVHSLFHETFQ